MRKYSELYHLALEIKDLNPWLKIHYTDKILLEDEGKLVFYSLFEFDHSVGIAMYEGVESIYSFFHVFTNPISKEHEPHFVAQQQFSMCLFVDKNELNEFDVKIYDLLKIDLEEDVLYPSFYFKKAGYPPRILTEEKVGEVEKYLYHLKQILQKLNSEEIYCDFEKEEYIIRKYCPDKDEWINVVSSNLILPEQRIDAYQMTDNEFESLKKQLLVKRTLIIDYRYLAHPIHDDDVSNSYYPVVVALFDEDTDEIIDTKICRPYENYLHQCLKSVLRFIEEVGIPEQILIIQEDVFYYVHQVLKSLDIKVLVTYDFTMTNYLFNYLSEEIKLKITDNNKLFFM